jgi:hypothetical protein
MKNLSIPHVLALCAFLVSVSFTPLSGQEASASPTAPAPAPDFGNYSSETLTTKAWGALASKNYAHALVYTGKCIELYAAKAKEMQDGLEAPAPADTASSLWALNDVGTCYYIRGQIYEAQSKTAEAVAAYKTLIDEFSFAQTWDTKGWFWSPAGAAKQRVQVLEFEAL